jgi:hypothetical protein
MKRAQPEPQDETGSDDWDGAEGAEPGRQLAIGISEAVDDGRRFAGRRWIREDLSFDERLRSSLTQWTAQLHPDRFGTLTLRTKHGFACNDSDCDGNIVCGTDDCFVPGLRATELAVVRWLGAVESAVVVEEMGSITGRRHFHFLASGTGYRPKRLARNRACKRRCFSNGANHVWERDFGHVDEQVPRSLGAVTGYVIKYVLKAQGETDYDERPLRWWWKR